MARLVSKYEQLISQLKAEGKVTEMDEQERQDLIDAVEKELEDYRFDNQKRIQESQEQLAKVVLTS